MNRKLNRNPLTALGVRCTIRENLMIIRELKLKPNKSQINQLGCSLGVLESSDGVR